MAKRRQGRPYSDAGRNPGVENVFVDANIAVDTLIFGEETDGVTVITE